MNLLETDTFSLLAAAYPRVAHRFTAATDLVTISVVTRIEALSGRFAFLRKAADGAELLRAPEWLRRTDAALALFSPFPFDTTAATAFDQMRANKKLKRIGRADLLIASIALAHQATLVTRNLKDFRLVPGLHIENWAD